MTTESERFTNKFETLTNSLRHAFYDIVFVSIIMYDTLHRILFLHGEDARIIVYQARFSLALRICTKPGLGIV